MSLQTKRIHHPFATTMTIKTSKQRRAVSFCQWTVSTSVSSMMVVFVLLISFWSLDLSDAFSTIPTILSSPITMTTTYSKGGTCRSQYVRLYSLVTDEQTKTETSMQNDASESNLPSIPFITKSYLSDRTNDVKLGEDAGIFDIQQEEWGALGERGWFTFSVAVGTIMTAVAVLWVIPSTGYADDFLHALETATGNNSHLITLAFGIIFPIVHSGLASLRPYGEQVVGARMWRVIFAFPSLCLAYSWITYFIAHAHDGIQFYDISGNPTAHSIAWVVNFLSFFFLYPSVFNLKEVAAVEPPTLHLWETGIIRISRHPQFVGQGMWSAAHLAMVGTSFTALTMILLVAHHTFACWNGDRRYRERFGDELWTTVIKERTSIVPFQAIWEGRQILPPDYYKELLRGPYFVIAVGTLMAYLAHPYMQGGAALVQNTGWVPGGIFG